MMNDVIIVAGPTASGKTLLSLHIAAFLRKKYGLDSEIINADSIQLYKDLKVLTAHPSLTDMGDVAHNLFGILGPNDSSNVVLWLQKAQAVIENLRAKNKIAIICGGTGFYIRAITDGIAPIPKIPQNIRQQVRKEFNTLGKNQFLEKLLALDYSFDQRHKNDVQRILRAYEVAYFTGKPLSEWWRSAGNSHQSYHATTFLLSPDRSKLHELCYRRVQKMMRDGAPDELMDFMRRYPDYGGPLSCAIGYADLKCFVKNELSETECIGSIFIKTRQYIKQQCTWFRYKLPEAFVLNGSGYDSDVIINVDDIITSTY
ncbi:MAG: tRNA (adenosine(37)-N6)-dimethylallyltransferase MiaA [Holosporaceae bacterium]|jgi:tRNA dimethylallyltransferase|nr:tRNA (adenosine(37)-N6)-dimethylallyltransferase MiaA [Holosporaceae bacterium]